MPEISSSGAFWGHLYINIQYFADDLSVYFYYICSNFNDIAGIQSVEKRKCENEEDFKNILIKSIRY